MRFYYILQENPHHPEMIIASSKQEVKSILMENLNSEDQILNIFSESEFNKMYNNDGSVNAIYADSNNYKNAKDFFNNVIKAAGSEAENIQHQEEHNNLKPINDDQPVQEQKVEENIDVKIFELNGEKIMVKNNKLYKLSWFSIKDDDLSNYRILNQKTGKEVKNENYIIQKLDWIEVQNN